MSNLDSLVLEPIEQPLSNTPNMLSNEDRVLCNMTPLQRLYSIDEDTYEELVCVWAYSCLGNKGYTEVYRVGQAGDKGRDVLAYYDRVKGAFDLYQCKQYKSALTYSDLCGEMGKLLIYTLITPIRYHRIIIFFVPKMLVSLSLICLAIMEKILKLS